MLNGFRKWLGLSVFSYLVWWPYLLLSPLVFAISPDAELALHSAVLWLLGLYNPHA